jgi:imidazolonepropionase-like amidohydrolase
LVRRDILVMTTRGGARAMGRLDELGTIEPGKIADAVLLGADPATSASHFGKGRYVIRGGEIRSVDEFRVR